MWISGAREGDFDQYALWGSSSYLSCTQSLQEVSDEACHRNIPRDERLNILGIRSIVVILQIQRGGRRSAYAGKCWWQDLPPLSDAASRPYAKVAAIAREEDGSRHERGIEVY